MKEEIQKEENQFSVSSDSPIVISSDTDFVNQGWPGNGSASSPYIIENQIISSSTTCISISGTSSYFIVRGCDLTINANDRKAISLANVANGKIMSNRITFDLIGLELVGSSSCLIENNSIHRPALPYQTGIRAIRVYDSIHIEISRNKISSAFVGHSGSANTGILVDTSAACIIEENSICPFLGWGIYLESSLLCDVISNLCDGTSSGYYVRASNDCYLEDNIATHTGMGFAIWVGQDHTLVGNLAENLLGEGFILANSYDCQLIDNIIRDISDNENGIEIIYGASNNLIYRNFILCENVLDDGSYNMWDNGLNLGNYWSSYYGTGMKGIPGTAGSIDGFPQLFITPAIGLASSPEYEYGMEEHVLSWTYTGQAPISYTLERLNESQMYQIESEGLWNESQTTLSLNLEPTEVGEYNYRFTAWYVSNYHLTRELTAYIYPESGPNIQYVLTDYEHPRPNSDIYVRASVNDISGVSVVTLSYCTSKDAQWYNVTMRGTQVNLWTAVVPGQMNATILYLKVYANDTLGNWAVTDVIEKLVIYPPPTPSTTSPTQPDEGGYWLRIVLVMGIMVEVTIIVYLLCTRKYK